MSFDKRTNVPCKKIIYLTTTISVKIKFGRVPTSIMFEEINKKDETEAHDLDDRSVLDDDDSCDDGSIVETFVDCECLKEKLSSSFFKAVEYLQNVAEFLDINNTRKHLIPYLTQLIVTEELSELKNLAVILGDFEKYVGGPRYAHIILLPLEELAGAKLNDVRMAAIRSLQTMADIMEVSDLETHFLPLIANMTMNDKCTKRSSVCHLFSTVYMRVNPKHQGHLINYHRILSLDLVLSVRQEAVKCLVDLSQVVCLSDFDNELIPRLKEFSTDQNEHVRILALLTALSFFNTLEISYIKRTIFPIILNFVNDSSWEVRLIVIKHIVELLIIGVSCSDITEKIIQILIVSTKDQQLEIRLQCIDLLYACAVILFENSTDLKNNEMVTGFLIPVLCDLSRDSDVECRLKMLPVLAKFGKIICNNITKDRFVDLVNKLIEDENVDVVFNTIKYMKDILGPEYSELIILPEDRLVCSLKALIINDSWERRSMGAIYLGILTFQKGLKYFEQYLEQPFLILFTDTELVVQQTAMDVLKLFIKEFGKDWAETYILPYLTNLEYSRNTYKKMSFLKFTKH